MSDEPLEIGPGGALDAMGAAELLKAMQPQSATAPQADNRELVSIGRELVSAVRELSRAMAVEKLESRESKPENPAVVNQPQQQQQPSPVQQLEQMRQAGVKLSRKQLKQLGDERRRRKESERDEKHEEEGRLQMDRRIRRAPSLPNAPQQPKVQIDKPKPPDNRTPLQKAFDQLLEKKAEQDAGLDAEHKQSNQGDIPAPAPPPPQPHNPPHLPFPAPDINPLGLRLDEMPHEMRHQERSDGYKDIISVVEDFGEEEKKFRRSLLRILGRMRDDLRADRNSIEEIERHFEQQRTTL